jgi:hypothetical protein
MTRKHTKNKKQTHNVNIGTLLSFHHKQTNKNKKIMLSGENVVVGKRAPKCKPMDGEVIIDLRRELL